VTFPTLLHRLRRSRWGLPLSWPAAGLYGAAVAARGALYDAGALTAYRAPCPVISVGGLEAGGTGKTPTAAYLLRYLCAQGLAPGLLTRGYGRQHSGLVLRARGEPATAAALGDEPAMLIQAGLDVPVAACAERRRGATALAALGCRTLVLDDGFAHRALARDLDIVVLRGEAPLDNGYLLPRGDLREVPAALGRAHLVWFNYRRGPPPAVPPPSMARWLNDKPVVLAQLVPTPPRDTGGQVQHIAGVRVIVAAGIARPEDLVFHLRAAGADVCHVAAFADHHAFSAGQMAALYRKQQRAGAAALVVTAKDAVRLQHLEYPGNLWICDTTVVVHYGAAELFRLLQGLRKA
jgi:tetraacyldisaccharide 4'-kinase